MASSSAHKPLRDESSEGFTRFLPDDTPMHPPAMGRRERRKAVEAIPVLALERYDVAASPDFYWTDNQPRITILRSDRRQPSSLPEITLTRGEAVALVGWLRTTEERLAELYGARS